MKRAVGLYVCLIVIAVVQAAYYHPRLPDTVASRFGFSGEPVGYMSKGSMVASQVGVVVFVAALFLAVDFIMPRVPDSLVSLPNKDYWLAPERRAQTHAAISSSMLWIGCATIVFMLGAFQTGIRANLSEGGTLRTDVFWVLFAVYVVFVFAWMIWFFRRFVRVPG